MGQAWEVFAPGKGVLVARALAELPKPRARPANFAGVEIVRTLSDRLNTRLVQRGLRSRPELGTSFNATYAGLSHQSHPNARLALEIRLQREEQPSTGEPGSG